MSFYCKCVVGTTPNRAIPEKITITEPLSHQISAELNVRNFRPTGSKEQAVEMIIGFFSYHEFDTYQYSCQTRWYCQWHPAWSFTYSPAFFTSVNFIDEKLAARVH